MKCWGMTRTKKTMTVIETIQEAVCSHHSIKIIRKLVMTIRIVDTKTMGAISNYYIIFIFILYLYYIYIIIIFIFLVTISIKLKGKGFIMMTAMISTNPINLKIIHFFILNTSKLKEKKMKKENNTSNKCLNKKFSLK